MRCGLKRKENKKKYVIEKKPLFALTEFNVCGKKTRVGDVQDREVFRLILMAVRNLSAT